MYSYVVKRIKGGGERPRILIRYPPGFAYNPALAPFAFHVITGTHGITHTQTTHS